MKFKKGDVVSIPNGTPTVMATPMLLVKTVIKGKMEYNAVGKIDTVRAHGIVTVAVWDSGRSWPWYCNVKAKDLRPADCKLGYDRKREVLTVTYS